MVDCPKCHSKLYEQYGNGILILLCIKCKYEKKIREDIPRPTPKPQTQHPADSFDFAKTMYEAKEECRVIEQYVEEKTEPEYSTKTVDEVIQNKTLATAIKKNIGSKLYQYQEQAYNEIIAGSDVVITAPTASGKTQSFLIPTMEKILASNSKGKISALFIYPTKALASDQVSNIKNYTELCGLNVAKIDGDVKTWKSRLHILKNPLDILVTNFDFLSWHLARQEEEPNSKIIIDSLSNVNKVVVDETHVCTGFFGANIHWILRRLQRFNKNLQFIAASATLEEPEKFCGKLFPKPMKHIDGKGKRGKITLQLLEPLHGTRSLMINLVRQFVIHKQQVLAFNKSRKEAERVAIDGSDSRVEIRTHKAGLGIITRRSIEIAFRDNKLQAISCTPTLELGINIGNLTGVISTYTSRDRLTQRMGRAGRRGQDAYGFLILDRNDPISQYYINNPDHYFEEKNTHLVNFENPLVKETQILYMAKDKPLDIAEIEDIRSDIELLEKEEKLIKVNGKFHCSSITWNKIDRNSIRDIGTAVKLKDINEKEFEPGSTVEVPFAYDWLHEGAIYLHNKIAYRSKKFHKHEKYPYAILEKLPPKLKNHETYPIKSKKVLVSKVYLTNNFSNVVVSYCKVQVKQTIHQYGELPRGSSTDKAVIRELSPPLYYDFYTLGIVLKFKGGDSNVNVEEMEYTEEQEPEPILHATAHLLLHAAMMIIGSESRNIDGLVDGSYNTAVLYDYSMNGGNGFSKAIFDNLESIFTRAYGIVDQCKCKKDEGCPRCTNYDGCNRFNAFLNKNGAKERLKQFKV